MIVLFVVYGDEGRRRLGVMGRGCVCVCVGGGGGFFFIYYSPPTPVFFVCFSFSEEVGERALRRTWRMPAGRVAEQQLNVDVEAEPLSIVVFPWPSTDCKRSGCSGLAGRR